MNIGIEYWILIGLILLTLIVDIFRLWNFKALKKHILIFVVKIFLVTLEFTSVKFGLNIMDCVSKLNETNSQVCSSSELNTLIFGIGMAFIVVGLIGYVMTLINIDLEDLKKDKRVKSKKRRS